MLLLSIQLRVWMWRCWWPLTLQRQEASQRIYCNENHTNSCLFHTVMCGLSALVHIWVFYPLHSLYFLGFGLVLFGVYLDVFPPCSCSASDLFTFGGFFQSFYFQELDRKEQKLSPLEDHSNRSGSVITRIMIYFVVVTLEKVFSSPKLVICKSSMLICL